VSAICTVRCFVLNTFCLATVFSRRTTLPTPQTSKPGPNACPWWHRNAFLSRDGEVDDIDLASAVLGIVWRMVASISLSRVSLEELIPVPHA
jgi:hypothetical protein